VRAAEAGSGERMVDGLAGGPGGGREKRVKKASVWVGLNVDTEGGWRVQCGRSEHLSSVVSTLTSYVATPRAHGYATNAELLTCPRLHSPTTPSIQHSQDLVI
jgi:hypothetical protein